MARLFACYSLCRNPLPNGKDEPTGPALIKESDTYTFALIVSCALTSASAPAPALLLAPALIDANATVRYSKADL